MFVIKLLNVLTCTLDNEKLIYLLTLWLKIVIYIYFGNNEFMFIPDFSGFTSFYILVYTCICNPYFINCWSKMRSASKSTIICMKQSKDWLNRNRHKRMWWS
jgi:hypothetical protein